MPPRARSRGPRPLKAGGEALEDAAKLGSKAERAVGRAERYGVNVENLNFSRKVLSYGDRPYRDSKLLIDEITESADPVPDPRGTGGLMWIADGSFNGKSGKYELLIDPVTNTVWHFLYSSR